MADTYPCCEHCDHFDPETGTDSAVVDDPPPHALRCPAGCNDEAPRDG